MNMTGVDSPMSRVLVLLTVTALVASPLPATGMVRNPQQDRRVCTDCCGPECTADHGSAPFTPLTPPAPVVASIDPCCDPPRPAPVSAPPASDPSPVTGASPFVDLSPGADASHPNEPAPCTDPAHCPCCLALVSGMWIVVSPSASGAAGLTGVTYVRAIDERCAPPGWRDPLLRPPIG